MTEIADVSEVLIRPVAMAVVRSEGMDVDDRAKFGAKPASDERLRELVDIARNAKPIGDDPVERIRELRD